ncbi:sigma-70 family RNA polymerase sigma factor [bacterium]|nr:sigma-70 family RNA polymerase sigma factor [bacterium]
MTNTEAKLRKPRQRLDPSDEVLIGRLAEGDQSAFNEIFDRYHRQIYNFIAKQVNDRESCEDLTQEVFMRVYKSASNFDTSKKFTSWLYKIALNEVKRHWKRTGARQTYSLNTPLSNEAGEAERADFIEDAREVPEDSTESELFSRNLRQLIDQLPDKQRTVVLLKVYQELTFEEIAEICECPLSTVLSRMRYAVDKLRRWLGVEDGQAEYGL